MPSYEGITGITITFALCAAKRIMDQEQYVAAELLRLPGEIYCIQAVPGRIKK
jgi:hypothetical protein